MFRFFVWFVLFVCGLYGSEGKFAYPGKLAIEMNVKLSNGHSILILSDYSKWELYPVKERKQTWKEWLYKIQVIPPEKEFLCDFGKWHIHSPVTVQPYDWALVTDEQKAKYNNKEIDKCHFIIRDLSEDQLAFARSLSTIDMVNLFKEECKRCYLKGKGIGEDEGYWDGWVSGMVISKALKDKSE